MLVETWTQLLLECLPVEFQEPVWHSEPQESLPYDTEPLRLTYKQLRVNELLAVDKETGAFLLLKETRHLQEAVK